MTTQLRFYSFVAGLYISELQKGLQTGHALTEMHATLLRNHSIMEVERDIYDDYCVNHKTIVILNALNSAGVEDAYSQLCDFGNRFQLPVSIFHEDEASLNGAATATGIIVPEQFFNAYKIDPTDRQEFPAYAYVPAGEVVGITYEANSYESQFISFLKGYRLA